MASASASSPDASTAAPRASARVRKAPEHYASSPFTGTAKRKRDGNDDAEEDVDMEDEESDEPSDDEDDEPDEEEIRERARKSKSRKPKSTAAKTTTAKKPAQKKAKTNGLSLPFRGGNATKKRVPKKAKAVDSTDAEAAGGLYADLFAHDKTMDEVVAAWLKAFEEHESLALADVVNFVLKCAGCNGKLTEHDIEDPDGATAKLTDLQDEHQATEPTEYPLIAKGKNTAAFKQSITAFLHRFTKALGASGLLVSNPELMENIEVWLSTMSTASNRSFRHTAAVASLSIITALCEVAKDLAEKAASSLRHAETERKKARANKERVKDFANKAKEAGEAFELVRKLLKDWFDTIFIHRYRDIDPTVRRDCAAALGDWITTVPEIFFDVHHLRYLGWLLSDESGATRGEVLKQLLRLYKDDDKLSGLRTFTEKFRPRFVEIGTSDVELNVRIAGLELLDVLRQNDLLEPDDIDAVGRLVFHEETKIRKAVAGFFAENVNDLFDSKVADISGSESLEETLPDPGEDNFEAPRPEWLKFKSLAEMLQSYDVDDQIPDHMQRNAADGGLILRATNVESRFTLAVDALYAKIDNLAEWQALAGYLLFDHSAGHANGSTNDTITQFRQECKLSKQEEVILLEVLNACVKRSLSELAEPMAAAKGKATKKQREDMQDELEEAVRNLSDLTPKLLKKFGDTPGTAAAVLRLEGVFSLPSLQSLRQDPAISSTLLDDLRKQFMSHGTDEVLAPATAAILHAKAYGELDDSALEKLTSLWDDVVGNLAELLDVTTITIRGASRQEELAALSNNLLRIVRLSTVSSCIQPLEDTGVAARNDETEVVYNGAIDFIIDLILRAVNSSGTTPSPEEAALEDLIAARAADAAMLYFQWKLSSIMDSIKSGTNSADMFDILEPLAARRDAFVEKVASVLDSRKPGDQVCFSVTTCLLDLYTSAAVLRTQTAKPGTSDDYTVLIMDLETEHEKAVMRVFAAHEKDFARLSGKKLEGTSVNDEEADVDVDADPIDDDPISDSESDDEDTQAKQHHRDAKLAKPLIAEQKLCELTGKLIFAITAGVVDRATTQKRLERNKTKLGPNFKEVLAYLDLQTVGKKKAAVKGGSKAKPKARGVTNGVTAKKNFKSNAIVAEDEVDDEIEDDEDEEVTRAKELNDDNEREPEEEEEDQEMINGDPVEEESVLGD
jgi:cohesin complex subunit SA-1/2